MNDNKNIQRQEEQTKEVINEIKKEYTKTADFLEDNTDTQLKIAGELKEELKNNDFDGAFNTFLNRVDEVYSKVKPDGSFSKEPKGHVPYLIGILGSFFIAFIIVQTGAATLKSVRFSRTANSYIKQNSMVINEGFDKFLYRNVTRRSKSKSSSSDDKVRSSGSSPHSSHTSGKF